jgi:hypothetical protein
MSAKRVLFSAVLCLGLIFGFFQRGSAQAGNVCNIPQNGQDQTLSNSVCDTYTTGYGWSAVSPGLVKDFILATSITASFTGNNVNFAITPQQAAKLWGPIQIVEDEIDGLNCPTGLLYLTKFRWNLGKLDPGTYTLTFFDKFNHPVTDGSQICKDDDTGERLPIIIYSGTLLDNVKTITITP